MTDATPDPLTVALRRLPEPAPPDSLEATVMARIARLPAPADDAAPEPARRRKDAIGWARAAAGLLVSLASTAFVVMSAAGAQRTGVPWPTPAGLDLAAASPLAPLPLAAGLLLLAMGLFTLAGIASRSPQQRSEAR